VWTPIKIACRNQEPNFSLGAWHRLWASMNERRIEYHAARARGGVGLTTLMPSPAPEASHRLSDPPVVRS